MKRHLKISVNDDEPYVIDEADERHSPQSKTLYYDIFTTNVMFLGIYS
jgi:hypothetical protein